MTWVQFFDKHLDQIEVMVFALYIMHIIHTKNVPGKVLFVNILNRKEKDDA